MTTAKKTHNLHVKNKKTLAHEIIKGADLTKKDWGFSFFVDSELDAYKAAYEYRNSEHGAKVEFSQSLDKWMITVFNAFAKECGIQ